MLFTVSEVGSKKKKACFTNAKLMTPNVYQQSIIDEQSGQQVHLV
jgi:hypothetical protein